MPADSVAEVLVARRLLARLLPEPAALHAFCVRHFPAVVAHRASAAPGSSLAEHLLSRATVAEVRYRLAIENPQAVALHTDYSLQLGPPAGVPLPLRSLPQPRDSHFTGRAEQLGILRGLLARHKLVAITGPAGVGKTALAMELAHRLAEQYLVVYAVSAATPAALRQGLHGLALQLGERGLVTLAAATNEDQCSAIVRDFLNRRADWLLVVDDVRDLPMLTTLLAPNMAAGHLLMTSADLVPPEAVVFEPGPLAEAEALQLLARRSNRHQLVPGERAAVQRLARALAYWPAALCSVADALRERGGTWIEALTATATAAQHDQAG